MGAMSFEPVVKIDISNLFWMLTGVDAFLIKTLRHIGNTMVISRFRLHDQQ